MLVAPVRVTTNVAAEPSGTVACPTATDAVSASSAASVIVPFTVGVAIPTPADPRTHDNRRSSVSSPSFRVSARVGTVTVCALLVSVVVVPSELPNVSVPLCAV